MLTTGCTALTDSQYTATLRSFAGRYAARDRAIFVLGSRTGFRISELLSLTVLDVFDSTRGTVRESVTVARQYMKGGRKSRTMPLHEEARAAIFEWLRNAQMDHPGFGRAYLFPRQGNYSVPLTRQHADSVIRSAYKRAGLTEQGTHSMRKTFASRLWSSPFVNGDMFKMRELMGHENLSNTAKYVQFLDGSLERAVLA